MVLQLGLALLLLSSDKFAFTIGSPVAAQDFRTKGAAFVFRADNCADLTKVQVSASAEGLLKGERKSVALQVMTSSKPGVYAVFQNWPSEGTWLVNIKGTCAEGAAGALIPIGPKGFVRESAKFFDRPAKDSEVESSLKNLAKGEKK